ncbi:MAG: sensor histidine kinase, partial [Bacteroidota bacterium]
AMKYSGRKRAINVRLKLNREKFAIEVKDHGIGIPEAELANIFEKFYRVREGTARHAAGTGLGLALVKHIMDAHGGEVKVHSKVGKGSTFTLLFPIRRAKFPSKGSRE